MELTHFTASTLVTRIGTGVEDLRQNIDLARANLSRGVWTLLRVSASVGRLGVASVWLGLRGRVDALLR